MTDNEIFETEIKCINRRANGKCNGGTDCCKCDLLMNEKDIISAYERAIANNDLINRQQAEIQQITEKFNCQQTVYCDLSKIIKDQKAEIERSKAENLILSQKRANIFEIVNANEKGKARGIKEFAERLKEKISQPYIAVNVHKDIDNLVKEMVGEEK